jgi:YHS domain-containing protein
MSLGRLEDINPRVFTIYRGKLYLFRDEEAKGLFLANPERAIREGIANYFELARQKRERY